MVTIKYFDAIRQAQESQRPVSEMPPFAVERLRGKGLGVVIAGFFIENPRWWLALLQRFRPNAGIGRFLLVTRNADVRDILERGDEFITPYGLEMAEMAGGWPDGSSLARNPEGRPGRAADNDFSFGAEDPQGLRCPLGSHVRRANPRDSLGEDRETQIRIGKRHRILRVGRTYQVPGKQGARPEKGLLFMCLNADIERQYEFIQQTWVSSASFHGLVAEKDPTIGCREGDGRFTIPSWEGVAVLRNMPQFVTTRGGGYFFMPSRSALRYLVSRL